MKLLPSLFGCLYSRVKLFVFATKSRRKELKIKSYHCRLPSAVNVVLNLSSNNAKRRDEMRINFHLGTLRSPKATWTKRRFNFLNSVDSCFGY